MSQTPVLHQPFTPSHIPLFNPAPTPTAPSTSHAPAPSPAPNPPFPRFCYSPLSSPLQGEDLEERPVQTILEILKDRLRARKYQKL